MKILLICHRIPYPPNKGEKIRAFNILKYLSQHHEVYLASLVDDPQDMQFTESLKAYAKIHLHERIRPVPKKLSGGLGLLKKRPVSVTYFYSPNLQKKIDLLLDDVPIDCLFCSSSPTAEYIFRSRHFGAKLKKATKVMDLIDVDSFKWREYAGQSRPPMSWVYSLEADFLQSYEKRIADHFKHLLLVSQIEKSLFAKISSTAKVSVLSNGVDLNYYCPSNQPTERSMDSRDLLFVGAMDYWPNVQGILWFVERVWPSIEQAVPTAALTIVGHKPVSAVKDLEKKSSKIRVVGFTPDIRPYLIRADVCVVPLLIARGIQNKVLEAMAMGKPVVCTPQAHQGIGALPGRDLQVAEGPERFAEKVIDLLFDQARAEEMGRSARLHVVNKFSWERNLAALDAILADDRIMN